MVNFTAATVVMIPSMEIKLDHGRKASTPHEPQTVDGWTVGTVSKSTAGRVFAWLWQPDPRGYGVKGPTYWYMNGKPVDPDDPALKIETIPFFSE